MDNYYDDKAKLLANSLTGGIYDLGQLLWEGNPLSYMTGEDFPGIGEWATGMTPFEDGGGTFFDYDEGFEPFGFEPESAEEVGRLLSSFAVPFGGIFAAPNKAGKAIDMMSKVFPSMKYFQDLGNLNKINRAYKYMKNKIPGQPSGLTKVWDSFVKPITQTFHRPLWAPFKKSQWFINKPTKFKRGWNTFVDQWAKPWGQMFTRPFNPMNWLGRKKQLPKLPGDKMPPPGRFTNPRWVKPEITYAKNAARNWGLATGAKYGIEGIKSVVDRHPKKFDRYSYEGEFDMGSAAPYEDKIMKMAKSNKPRIGIQFSDGPTHWG